MSLDLVKVNNVSFFQVKSLLDTGLVKHAITTRLGGISREQWAGLNLAFHVGDNPEDVVANRKIISAALGIDYRQIVAAKQVHGDRVYKVTERDLGRGALDWDSALDDIDALMTNVPGVPLATFYADCVPLLILDPVTKVIALAHAGWKGTVARIGCKTLEAMMREYGTKAQHCLVVIAPSIGPCCYEVDEPLVEKFDQEFSQPSFLQKISKDKWRLDLWECNRQQFKDVGVPEENIDVAGICTCCNANQLFSYRADQGKTGRLAAIMMLEGEQE